MYRRDCKAKENMTQDKRRQASEGRQRYRGRDKTGKRTLIDWGGGKKKPSQIEAAGKSEGVVIS